MYFVDRKEQNDAINYALEILELRAKDISRTKEASSAYESSLNIILNGLKGNIENLRQFDY